MEFQGLYQWCINSISPVVEGFSHLFWPGQCLICQHSICPEDDCLCLVCWQNLSKSVASDFCRRCGRDVSPFGIVNGRCGFCQNLHFDFDGIARVGTYESTLRSLILAYKFSEKTELRSRLSRMLQSTVAVSGFLEQVDIISPVPLHWRRKLWRGFNQSYLLARSLDFENMKISTDLVRIRNTAQQWDLTGPQRRRNVKGAFAVRKGHPFFDKTVLLIDDITTSNATLNECAKTLKSAGAQQVYVAVLATAFHDE